MRAPAGPSGRIYAIADVEALHPAPLPAAVRDMAEAGIRWIQVRAKQLSGSELFRQMELCCRALEGSGVRLWVDDRADVAALFPPAEVAGLHVGQRDLPPAAARRVVGDEMWIGLSTHDEQQLLAADADPEVDVIAVGPVFPTTGKASPGPPDPVLGLDFLRRARKLTAKPLVAIGGINAGNLAQVLASGADTAAVIGAVCRGDVRANALRLIAQCGST